MDNGKREIEQWKQYWNHRAQTVEDLTECAHGSTFTFDKETNDFNAKRLRDALSLRPDGILLDVGCGTGDSLVSYYEQCAKIIGIDLAEEMCKLCKQRLIELKMSDVSILCVSGIHIPLRASSVDAILSVSVFQYLSEAMVIEALKEFFRVAQGGTIVLHVKNSFNLFNLYYFVRHNLLSRLREKMKPSTGKKETSSGNVEIYDHYRPYWWYRKQIGRLGGQLGRQWSFSLYRWNELDRLKLAKVVERFERTMRKRRFGEFLLRPFGIEYYFQIRVPEK